MHLRRAVPNPTSSLPAQALLAVGRHSICCAGAPVSRWSIHGDRAIPVQAPAARPATSPAPMGHPRYTWNGPGVRCGSGRNTSNNGSFRCMIPSAPCGWCARTLPIGDTATDRTADYTRWMDEDVEGGEKLTPDEAHARFPQISMDGIRTTLYEKDAGILFARRACYAVIDGFLAEGGVYRQAGVVSTRIKDGEMQEVSLSDGSRIKADRYVFACGPWLGNLFPDAVGRHLAVTRQEIYYLDVPGGDKRFYNSQLPHWVDWGREIWWGVPAHQRWGFAVADHGLGPVYEPTSGDRQVSNAGKEAARAQVGARFPGMKGAVYLTGRVCQYTNTPDGDYIIDRHPEAENAWIYGGGSGTGFHAGPARGQDMAKYVLGHGKPDPRFSLSRFSGPA